MNDDESITVPVCTAGHQHRMPEFFLGSLHTMTTSYCIREVQHAGKHLDYFGNYWTEPSPPLLPQDRTEWRAFLIGFLAAGVLFWVLR